LISALSSSAQNKSESALKWWNPAKSGMIVVEGQPWPKEVEQFYDRFPLRAKQTLRKEVWDLSRNAAGLKLRFKTNSKTIKIRYTVVAKNYAMDHFPATGRSGVDLYALNNNQTWAWASGKYKFADTITYEFTNLDLDTENYKTGREYFLYLPIYNTLKWIEVGVSENADFTPLAPRLEKPIVVYGTSIAQGGCASRPGMAWTAILERDLHLPVVNLAFSGNGRLEPEVISLVNEIDAKVFVLDCLPNLSANSDSASLNVQRLIINAVKTIREKHPNTPILLAEHSGFIENRMDAARRKAILALNDASNKAYKQLQQAGFKNIFVLPAKEINMGTDGTVDGTHPSDLGMYRYAQAYQKSISALLKQQKPK
jgi:hypothetical protein